MAYTHSFKLFGFLFSKFLGLSFFKNHINRKLVWPIVDRKFFFLSRNWNHPDSSKNTSVPQELQAYLLTSAGRGNHLKPWGISFGFRGTEKTFIAMA